MNKVYTDAVRGKQMVYREYDEKDPKSIEKYAQRAVGKTFQDILDDDRYSEWGELHEPSADIYEGIEEQERKHYKGKLGQLIEEKFFHYDCNSDSSADFKEAGVELKVTPYKVNLNGSQVAKERVSLTMINYMDVVKESFFDSHLWKKCGLILFMWYRYNGKDASPFDQSIDYAQLFTPNEEDLKIIIHDFEIIVNKVKAGKAHELSEADTMYLGAAPKASNVNQTRPQPFSNIPARLRAFTYKNSYMTYVLNNYFIPGKKEYERILPEGVNTPFEEYVVSKIDAYKGWTVPELAEKFGIETKAKSIQSNIAFRILGIKNNKAEEFAKAGIVVKAIRIQNTGIIKESMSFPAFKFKELVEENWEDSTFGNYLRETKFLFVVYKFDKNEVLHLQGCQFWNIPYEDLENDVRSVWEKTKKVIEDGLVIERKNGKYASNLPKIKDNRICHVRPHAKDSTDTDTLPDGRQYPKQCFWLNRTYIYDQIDKNLK